jgi:hypothetical protein
MAFSDFLSDGAPIPAGTAPINKTTTTTLPDWYTNYAMDILGRQTGVSSQPYPTYGAPRVAGLTPDQQTAAGQTRDASTMAQPAFNTAIDQTKSLFGNSSAAAAQPYFNQAAGASGLSAAQPYLNNASGTSAANVNTYMNPYTSGVVDRIGQLAGRNLNEQFLPALTDRFVGAGQGVGGTRQAELIGRGIRDLGESTLAQQTAALESGYTGALNAANTDLSRNAALAGTAGQLGTANQTNLTDIGRNVGALTGTDTTTGLSAADQLAKLGQSGQATALAGAGALNTIGGQQQTLNQQNLTTAYQDFLKQQGWPQEQIDKALATLGGVGSSRAVPTATSEIGITPTPYPQQYQPSTGALIGSGLATGAGIASDLFGAKGAFPGALSNLFGP